MKVNVTPAKHLDGKPVKRRQVYSNRPLYVFGYICPQEDGTFAVQAGDEFTRPDAPFTAEGFRSVKAAREALVG